ncbi:MAG: polysaccharide pyruvyl transferase family protein [Thomasclavelia sp.]
MERRLNKRNVKHYLYYTDTDLEGILNCIGSAEIVIATRFHAMILGWCMGKKTLPIVYSSKMTHVLEEFESQIK